MAQESLGNWLNQYVAPQLLLEFKNFKDDFIGVLPGVPDQALSADGVRYNRLLNNVGFLVDNSVDLVPASMTGDKVFVEWERYDTTPTSVSDDEIRYLNYDKRNAVRVKHTEAFKMGIRDHVMWKLAPETSNIAGMPVMLTTGANDGSGRKRLTFADLIKYLELVKLLNLPDESQYNLVLNPKHATDLIIDRDSAPYFANKEIFFNMQTGAVKSVMGFNFFENNAAVAYDSTGAKKAMGSTLVAGDQAASLFFYAPNSLYHIDNVKILYKPEYIDTRSASPTSEFRIQTYGLVDRVVDYGFGAIVSGNA
jgi:hypothetical protein